MIKTLKSTNYKIPLKYHFVFWLSYFIFNFIRYGSINNNYWYSLKSNLVEFPLNIIITYFTIYYLIPKFILKKKYLQFFLLFFLSLVLFYLIRTGLNYLLVTKNIWPEAEGFHKAFTFNHIIAVTIGVIYVIALVSTIKLAVDWMSEKSRNDKLIKIQLQTELDFLKTQIQPHFFFNTLNNLYALTIEKSDNAPEVILKLSEIMQYVLYDVKESTISLLKEINYIHSYLELEKLRYGTVKSQLTIDGNINDVNVPPLLFLPFIENCFKHGAKNNNDDIFVTINFRKEDDKLWFSVTNNFNVTHNIKSKHGIGIENVKRRLKLLYNDNFSLKTTILDDNYLVRLKIPI